LPETDRHPLKDRFEGWRNTVKRIWKFAILVFALTAAAAWAQRITATLSGIVHDPSQAAVPNAQVSVTNEETGSVFQAVTDQEGRFQAASLAPGRYSVAIQAPGFKRLDQKGLTLAVDQSAALDFVLQLGASTETVQITAEAPLLETASAQLGQVIGNRSIVNLPLNQRNPFSLILLAPNVTGSVGNGMTGLQFNVNGGRSGTTDVLLDGVSSSPPTDSFNGLSIFPSVDAVQEFKVQTNGYAAEFGLSGGGIINLIYKSGTNGLHGSAYEFLRNSAMDANNFFANRQGQPLASFKRSQFGGSVGGPVVIPGVYNGHNKTFFFADYEGLRQRTATNLLASVPTAAERAGDFTQARTAAGAPITIYDPNTTTLTGTTFIRQPFPGNAIPANRIDAVAAAVSKYWPTPNGAGVGGGQINNFAASSASPYTVDQYDIKMDQNMGDRHRLSIRWSQRNPASMPTLFVPQPIAIAQSSNSGVHNGATASNDAIGGALNYSFIKSSSDVIEFRYGVSRVVQQTAVVSEGFDPTQLGFPGYIRDTANGLAFPGFEFTNYYSIGQGSDLTRGTLGMMTQTWALSNTKSLSRHTLKFGAEVRALTNNLNQTGRATGDFSFSPALTQGPNAQVASSTSGDDFASFLLGLGSGTVTHNFKIVDTTSQYIGGYLQDDWKVSGRLTLNVGLRYELFIPRVERHDRDVYLDFSSPSPLAGPSGIAGLKGGLQYAGVNGNPRSQFVTPKKDFSPRLGFAYVLSKRAVLRGGYGIFYSLSPTEAAGTVSQTGYRTDSTYFGTIDGVTPAFRLSNPYPNGFVPVTGNSLGLATATGTSISGPLRYAPTPYTQSYNLGIQYQLPGDWLVEAAYTGSHGSQLIWNVGYNQLPVSALSLGSELLQTVPNPFFGVITNTGPLSGQTVQKRYLMAPYPQFTGVGWGYQPGATSDYNALTVRVEKRFAHDLGALVSFTKGKSMDDSSSNNTGNLNPYGTQQDFYNRHADWSLSTFDVSRRLVGSVVYGLPFGRHKQFGTNWNRFTDALLGGWQANALVTLQNGVPLALSASNVANIFNPGERPNNNGTSGLLSGSVESRLNAYFNTSVFSQPGPYTLGGVARTLPDIRTPGMRNVDLSLFKHFTITERAKLELRAESFNAFNTPVFAGPNTTVSSSSFGVITSQLNAPRQMQVALKILF
jgi:hypothetical protein